MQLMTNLESLRDASVGRVEWALEMPDFINPNLILVDALKVDAVANAMGSEVIRVIAEEGVASERSYGAYLTNSRWSPSVRNLTAATRSEQTFRTAANQEYEGRSIDWLIFNRAEMLDRFQEADFLPRSLAGVLFQSERVTETQPPEFIWSVLIDEALRSGLRSLIAERMSLSSPARALAYLRTFGEFATPASDKILIRLMMAKETD